MNSPEKLIVDVVAIQRHATRRRDVVARAELGATAVGDVGVVDSVADVDLVVEAITRGMSVTGTVRANWFGPCRRCLDRVEGLIEVPISEIFETEPVEGETWPIVDERIDLTPPVREAIMLALPLAPLCRDRCRGPVPDRFPTGLSDENAPKADPRWAVLDELSFEDD